MRTIIPFMETLWQRGMSKEKLYYWPFIPSEILEDAKENRDMNAGCALEGIGAESPTTGILAEEEPAARRHVRTHTHTWHQAPGKIWGIFP